MQCCLNANEGCDMQVPAEVHTRSAARKRTAQKRLTTDASAVYAAPLTLRSNRKWGPAVSSFGAQMMQYTVSSASAHTGVPEDQADLQTPPGHDPQRPGMAVATGPLSTRKAFREGHLAAPLYL